MKQAFLIYRPVLDYEESEQPYLITLSEDKAKAIVAKVEAHAEKLCRKLKLRAGNVESWMDAERHNSQVFSATEWPYGIDYSRDLKEWSDQWLPEGDFIQYKPLTLI